MSDAPLSIVVTTAGINCDGELVEAFELAGARVRRVHLNDLIADPALLDDAELIGLPGGFSYGDAVAAGRIMAQLMREKLYPSLVRAIERGVPMIAPCNGFQIAVQLGLLPGPAPASSQDAETAWPPAPLAPTVTLAPNDTARFVDRWVRVEVPSNTRCIWTRGLELDEAIGVLPVAHGEGRFVPAREVLARTLADDGRIAVRYVDNPNGSVGDIAGICDASGLVFGLMPHPERYVRWTSHPWWNRLPDGATTSEPPGLQMFRNAVRWVTTNRPSGAAVVRHDRGPAVQSHIAP